MIINKAHGRISSKLDEKSLKKKKKIKSYNETKKKGFSIFLLPIFEVIYLKL